MFRNVKIVHTEVEDGKFNDDKQKLSNIKDQRPLSKLFLMMTLLGI